MRRHALESLGSERGPRTPANPRRRPRLWIGGRDLAIAAATALVTYTSMGGVPPRLLLAGSHAAAACNASGLAVRLLESAAEGGVKGDRGTVEALSRLAERSRLHGRHAEAFAYLTRARLLLERAVGSRHRDVAPVLDELALVSIERGNLAEAAAFLHRALMIRTAAFGVDDRRVVRSLEDIADLRRLEGQFDEALRLARRVLALREESFEERSAYVARALGRIGAIHRERGQLNVAEVYLDSALEVIGPRALGARAEEDSDETRLFLAREVARIFTEAGVLRGQQERYGVARRLLLRSFQLYTGQSDEAARQAEILALLAETYRKEGQHRTALAHLRISLRLADEIPSSPAAKARIREAMDALRREMSTRRSPAAA